MIEAVTEPTIRLHLTEAEAREVRQALEHLANRHRDGIQLQVGATEEETLRSAERCGLCQGVARRTQDALNKA